MLSESFNSGAPRPDFWSQISGGVVYPLYEGQANFVFFGNVAGPRFARTLGFDTRSYQSLEFDLAYGDSRNGADPIDGNNDRIRLEYSTDNGATWRLIQEYTSPIAWTRFKVNLPPAAQTANTMFRWQQPANDGAGTDYWGLDNIELKTTAIIPPATVDFSAGLSDGFWSDLAGAQVTNTFAGRQSSLFFGSSAGSRFAQTVALNTSQYKTLDFDLIYGNGSNGGDAIDGNNDRIRLEYSTNNGLSWQVVQEFAATGNWSRFNVNLPPAAQSTSTLLRWTQPQNDGAGTDAWALDNIALSTGPVVTASQLSLSPLTLALNEGNSGPTPFTFTINRGGGASSECSVLWTVSVPAYTSSYASTSDFTIEAFPFGEVTFAAGETSKTITLNVDGDTEVESDESFVLTLSAPTGATLSPTASTATATILNDDSLLSIAPLSANKAEGNSGSTPFTFTVTRSGKTTGASTALWSVVPLTGITGADFVGGLLPSGTLDFAAGEISKTLTVNVAGDKEIESNENFQLTLSAPSVGTTLGTATATGTILNDDTSITINQPSVTKAEGAINANPFSFTITRWGNASGTSTVKWTAAGSGPNPANANDFTGPTSGTLTFTPGQVAQVLLVNVNGDTIQEADETFTLTLSDPIGAYLDRFTSTGIIGNDDLIGDDNPNTLVGTTMAEYINGGRNVDILTGSGNQDLFAFRFSESPINTPDVITDFAMASDKLVVLLKTGSGFITPVSFSRAADNANASTLADLAFSMYADSNGALPGNQILGANSAVIVRATNAAIAGIYVMVNDSVGTISATDDLMIKLGGFSGGLPALGAINPSTMFV